ncbi:MAG TPA: heme-dependent oxidative N-demethylase subunit alpha family protein [Acidimicrobiales bacterium]|nr:heme-dependent oxidative N-demethylase subunit alpha family protein [Acidimicrobiales bacterium]
MDDRPDAIWDAFDGRPHEVRMGLHPLDPGRWIQPPSPPALATELDRKAALLAERSSEVLASVDDADARLAAAELAGLVVDHLVRHHPDRYRRRGRQLVLLDDGRCWDSDRFDPLDLAGRVVAEDWCLVTPGTPPVLAAATLCSPNRWRLTEKLGRPITEIHDPVPHYRQRLATPVDAVLAGRHRGLWRRNWSIQSSPSRFQPVARGPASPQVPDEVWVRSEYETLVGLPASGYWVFGIQTTIRPLADVASRPALARRIHTAVATLDSHTAAYKDMAAWRDALVAWLARAGEIPDV